MKSICRADDQVYQDTNALNTWNSTFSSLPSQSNALGTNSTNLSLFPIKRHTVNNLQRKIRNFSEKHNPNTPEFGLLGEDFGLASRDTRDFKPVSEIVY